ncbi:hypothetical protein [Fluviicola sp.]|uniref:hypothetical protein n=1 Tax=Fluviicola sp. TaxID=1917219 RepID=UPI00262E3CA7|nr:hypothetical protein [Fluviicola sp.]
MFKILIVAFSLISVCSYAQVLTKEDSLSAGLIASDHSTVLSGYGSFNYSKNLTLKQSVANVDRVVLFIGHKFNKRISLFTELELEDARIEAGKPSGSFSLEQAFIKFNINRNNYLVTGLFIPRLGIINENHLPTTFNGNYRPYVETMILPSTWREIGVGYYGSTDKIPGLNYSCALITGLNSRGFTNGSGIVEGRMSGGMASTNSLAVTGALLYYHGNFRSQVSGYFGGTSGLKPYEADSLHLQSGAFGTPVGLVEANTQYLGKRLGVKVLATWVNIKGAEQINRAYANNTPEQMFGAYLDVSYAFIKKGEKVFRGFARYEYLNMNLKLPKNGIINETLDQQYIISGLSYNPIHGVMIKVEYTYRMTGNINPALIVTPYPVGHPYFTKQHFINLGIGYSF